VSIVFPAGGNAERMGAFVVMEGDEGELAGGMAAPAACQLNIDGEDLDLCQALQGNDLAGHCRSTGALAS
jgi:hypothetical protein